MDIVDLLKPNQILLDLKVRDKSALMSEIGKFYMRQKPDLPAATIQSTLLMREQLGSTGLGNGFALPHARLPGLAQFSGLFIRLAKPLPFDAIDGNPVDLLFVLLSPAESDTANIAALAAISRRFRDATLRETLRTVQTPVTAYKILTES